MTNIIARGTRVQSTEKAYPRLTTGTYNGLDPECPHWPHLIKWDLINDRDWSEGYNHSRDEFEVIA